MKKRIRFTSRLFSLIFIFYSITSIAFGRVLRVEIESRMPILQGKAFGEYGSYELIRGKVFFGFDPQNEFNSRITDLKLAPVNQDGLVEAWGDLVVLKPIDPNRSSGVALVEVSNRGGKFSPSYFNQANRGRELEPEDPEYWGDGLLMRQGLTVIWIGWQFDVPTQEHTLNFYPPIATHNDGSAILGKVRSDWTLDAPADTLSLGHNGQIPYTAIQNGRRQLTLRDGRDAPRQLVSDQSWGFTEDGKSIYAKNGFLPGKIYELVYEAKDPPVVGLGLVAIRDIVSYAKYDKDCPFPVKQGLAAGVSQTGRFLRTFLYHGLNTDEQGRMAYDGLMMITAGAGRGSFNHRFAQPSRDAHRYSAFFYPTDIFPFTSLDQLDPWIEKKDGILSHAQKEVHWPKIFQINTGYEYWGRTAALIHSSLDGSTDEELAKNERVYHLASGQHFVDRWPPADPMPTDGVASYRGNPLDFKGNYRALLIRLKDWVQKDIAPPPSKYPRISNGTLVAKEQLQFPAIPGVDLPTTIHHAYRTDYGDRWSDQGIVDHQPPLLGYAYPALVPQVDSLGNELGGIRNVEIEVPLATYTPWNLRTGALGGAHELSNFRGTFIPFPISRAQKLATNDPRPAIEDLYQNEENFITQVENAAKGLVEQGFLLPEDIAYVVDKARARWQWNDRNPYEGLTRGPKNGHLMIMGGGRLDTAIFQKFLELAGGPEAPIVIIPTAGPDDFTEREDMATIMKERFDEIGFKNVRVLHTRDPKEADTDAFVKPINEAGGVWIPGGRQWRLADSYLNTKTQEALQNLLKRGGVIGGTSAGATIQGSYLARGDTNGNTLMMGDHEEGLSFISNIAIDQHLMARNRQFDLYEILEHRPELLGIGLDENTGILVRGDQFEVIGKSYVAIYDGKKWSPERQAYFPLAQGEQKFYLLKPGQIYDMNLRRVIEKESARK